MTFSDIALLPEELRILRRLNHGKAQKLTAQELKDAGPLINRFYFIEAQQGGMFIISKEGRRYLVFHREDAFRHRWPVYLSIASAFVAVFSLLVSLASLIVTVISLLN